jgi:hypothetical protein
MKQNIYDATVKTAYGKAIEPIPFKYSVAEYETIAEVQAASDMPTEKEILDFRNTQRVNNARSKQTTAVLLAAGYKKPTLEEDDQLKLREMYKIFIAAKNTPDEARAKASAALNIEWAE